MNNYFIGSLVIALAVIVGFAFFGGDTIIEQYGATSGPDHYQTQYFHNGLVQGGREVTLTSGSTVTLTATNTCDYDLINWTPTAAAASATLDVATGTIDRCLRENDGEFKDIIFYNSGDAASTTVFATSTGVKIFIPEATGADLEIGGGDTALIRLMRLSSTSLGVMLQDAAKQ